MAIRWVRRRRATHSGCGVDIAVGEGEQVVRQRLPPHIAFAVTIPAHGVQLRQRCDIDQAVVIVVVVGRALRGADEAVPSNRAKPHASRGNKRM